MKLYLLLIFFLISNYANSQVVISGKIVDEKTNEGINGVSVYINNTTYGTETDADGKFSIKAVVNGQVTLVISHLVYERKFEVLTSANLTDLFFKLKPQENNLNEVIIKSKHSKVDLTKWINLFTYNLIGTYKGANNSKLKNIDALYFDFDQTTNNLKVYAKEPLIVENNFLNYEMKIDLDQFEYNFNSNEIIFKYFVFYSNNQKSSLSKNEIEKNRLFAYEGSNMHFMRSLFKDSYNVEPSHFYIFKYSATQNKEKQRVNEIIRQKTAETYVKYQNPNTQLSNLFTKDTAAYYLNILKEKDTLNVKTEPIEARFFTKKDKYTRTVNFNFPDTILIQYDKNKLSEGQLRKFIIGKDKSDKIKPDYLSSYFYFFKDAGINIQRNGYYPEFNLFIYGDMGLRRLGVSLPYDFDPEHPLQ